MKPLCALSFIVAVAACAVPTNNTPAGQKVADRIHEYVMDEVRDYVLTSGTKALAACVRWPEDGTGTVYVDTLGGSYVADQSDGQLSGNLIVNSAMRSCQGQQARGQYDCDCQLLDVGGSNRLSVPANVTDPDMRIRTRRSKVKRSEAPAPIKKDKSNRSILNCHPTACETVERDDDHRTHATPVKAASTDYGSTGGRTGAACPPITCEKNELKNE